MPRVISSFDYPIEGGGPVCLPEGETVDGLPVILFPPEWKTIIPGWLYDIKFSTEGTKTHEVDGKTYRVGNVYAATAQDHDEENFT